MSDRPPNDGIRWQRFVTEAVVHVHATTLRSTALFAYAYTCTGSNMASLLSKTGRGRWGES